MTETTPPVYLRQRGKIDEATERLALRAALTAAHLFASRILARAGWSVSARSVGRYRKERLVTPPPTPHPPESRRPSRPVVARFVHHVWMLDVSQVKQFLGPDPYMAAVLDAFSRAPLALQVLAIKPGAKDMARLLRRARRAFAGPRYVITDQGGEFTAGPFRKAVRRMGAVQRFASRDSILATARLQRFWRTLKENAGLYRLQLPLTSQDLEQRLALALFHYVCFRPHKGLRGATPAEAFLGLDPACRKAIAPPRGRPGEGPAETPFRVEYLDPAGGRFPILMPAA